eukprot:CAMPEP_0115672408 /NCGR_PEP_ID=MMETSP0272-20121206/52567_1 /TAXON_ID=71861 /ORGANISM="Scrippsiella trochoidea, Strain CCMP3099" /LENGTH=30 /DNA_ID= /DNA_START= /DNA_END= /DNA_ORIENTATION=
MPPACSMSALTVNGKLGSGRSLAVLALTEK